MITPVFHSVFILLFCAFTLISCADLRVKSLSHSPENPNTGDSITFTAIVENAGIGAAGSSKLSFKVGGESNPPVYVVPPLDAGTIHTVRRQLQLDVAQRYRSTVTVDINNTVTESNERNNRATEHFTVGSCSTPNTGNLPVITYNEGLATILRGVNIDTAAASKIGVPAGYYRIREFRVAGAPADKAKTINILLPYAEMFSGSSTLPVRDQEWVFSVVAVNDFEPHHRVYKAYDFNGHTFEYELTFDEANSCWNTAASIDCVEVQLSTKQYTSETLNSCGWTTEPPWTPIP